jgi:hypothetical protein
VLPLHLNVKFVYWLVRLYSNCRQLHLLCRRRHSLDWLDAIFEIRGGSAAFQITVSPGRYRDRDLCTDGVWHAWRLG